MAEKPCIEPTFQDGRYTLVDRSDSWNSVYGLGCAAAILTAVGTALVLWFLTALRESLFAAIAIGPFALIFAIAAIVIWVMFVYQLRVVRRYEPGELTLSHWPLRLGDDVTVTFERRMRGNRRAQSSGQLEAKLLCSERVIYKQGTSTRKAYASVSEVDLGNQALLPGGKDVSGTWQVRIPVEGPPSLEAAHNQLRWHVEIWLRQPKAVDDDSIFCLKVLPEVVA